ncbi:MAG: excinuclease ABC subunit UvrC [Candidatus Kerfeldbacteria bacterium]|nr:excinuclease ABC subunit UvrC [Candidatus Kerfeldbacteria bacterium]
MNLILKRQLNKLPDAPGVYKFFDKNKRLLYVGKAKSLRARVNSYFQNEANLNPAKQTMVALIASLETIRVKNETEALLLESNLIKQYRPLYNVVLKDDKSWLYLAIDYRADWPQVSLERTTKIKGVKYFGPYTSAIAARRTFYLLKKIFGLKSCSNPPNKSCFAARLGRCLGHNFTPQSKLIYRRSLKQAEKILQGKTEQIINELKQTMSRAAAAKKFELAAKQRDQIKSLEQIIVKQSALSPQPGSFDVFGLYQYLDLAAVCHLPIRHGHLLDTQNFLLEHTRGLPAEEIWEDFLPQYYTLVTNPPHDAYIPIKIQTRFIGKIKLTVVQRGYKRDLVKLAALNAQNFLEQSRTSWERQSVRAERGLKILQTELNLAKLPERLEGYDISNIQGQEAVGAMVVLTKGLPDPKSYRHFKIKGLTKPNDVAMLAQVIARRFTKNQDWPKPDLIMLDGGTGQLSTVQKVLNSYGVTVPIIALAKAEELIYLPNQRVPLRLESNNPGLLLLEQLRDEAHRFGIIFYRQRHRRRNLKSAWNELPGVGPKTKKLLKQEFGDLKNLRLTSLNKLEKILGSQRAAKLFSHLKQA